MDRTTNSSERVLRDLAASVYTSLRKCKVLNDLGYDPSLSIAESLLADPDFPSRTCVKALGSREGGVEGWYIDHPEFYCDMECEDGLWSVYFRHRPSSQEVYSDGEGTIRRTRKD